jgi:hypothetical protein
VSAYRVDGGTKIGGAHRPWGTETSESKRTVVYETEAQKLERETCLSCSLSVCNPDWSDCPLRKKPRPSRKNCRGATALPIPDEFHQLGPGPMTSKEIAEALDVSESTVKRWRKRFGYSRTRIDRRTKT